MPVVTAALRVAQALQALDLGHRTVADGEWGLRVELTSWPLDIGFALTAGGTWLRLQGEVCGPGQADPQSLLHRSRLTPVAKLTTTSAGAVWVEAWLPVAAVDAGQLDHVLGLMAATTADVRAQLA